MNSRLNNHNLPPVPPWDEIIARTKYDMAAQNFLSRNGLRMTIQRWGHSFRAVVSPLTYRDRGATGRPVRGQKQCSILFPGSGKRPVPRDVLAVMKSKAVAGSDFDQQRLQNFFTEHELAEMGEIQ
jgi:hypothetical protein